VLLQMLLLLPSSKERLLPSNVQEDLLGASGKSPKKILQP